MVSRLAFNDLEVSINNGAGTYYLKLPGRRDAKVLDGLTIQWGRDSLYSRPSNRTASMTFRARDYDDRGLSEIPSAYMYAELDVKMAGLGFLFCGFIDTVEVIPPARVGTGDALIKVSAVEAPTFDSRLAQQLDFTPMRTRDVFEAARGAAGAAIEDIITPPPSNDNLPQLTGKPGGVKGTARDLLEIGLAWRPLTFATTKPDPNGVVYTTTIGLTSNRLGSALWKFGAGPNHAISDENITASAQNTVRAMDFTTGGTYLTVDDGIRTTRRIPGPQIAGIAYTEDAADRFKFRQTWPTFEWNWPLAIDSRYMGQFNTYVDWAWELVRKQESDPVTFTQYDAATVYAAKNAWATWEPGHYFEVGMPSRALPEADYYRKFGAFYGKRLYPIGGTVRFNHDLSRHDMRCIYV